MIDRARVATLEDLDSLDDDEMREGYRDGFEDWPCGTNRSRAYWHGWRCAQIDLGRIPNDEIHHLLTVQIVARERRRA